MQNRTSRFAAVLFAATLVGATAQAADPASAGKAAPGAVAITDSARARFRACVNFLTDPDGARFEAAYRECSAAYAESPSWKILGNLGLAAMKLERTGEAIQAFERFLAEGGEAITPEERAQVERDLQTQKLTVVWLTLEGPAGASVTDERRPSAGAPVVNAYTLGADGTLRLGVQPGTHQVTVTQPGFEPDVWRFDGQTGTDLRHSMKLREAAKVAPATGKAAERSRPVPMLVWIGAATTGALAVGGGVTGFLASQKNDEYNTANTGSDSAQAKKLRDSGVMLNYVADGLFGAAALTGIATGVLYFMRPEREPEGRPGTSLVVAPAVTTTAAGVSVTGSF